MKKIILMSTVLLAGLSACEDYNDQFNIDSSLTDVKTGVTIQLASSDYGTIAGMEANKELALSKDPEGQTYVAALEARKGRPMWRLWKPSARTSILPMPRKLNGICLLLSIINIRMPIPARASRCNIICTEASRVIWPISRRFRITH